MQRRFFIHEAFLSSLARFRITAGDRFFDHPAAYTERWDEALKHVSASIVVLFASSGETGMLRYRLSHWTATGWIDDPDTWTTQRDFQIVLGVTS